MAGHGGKDPGAVGNGYREKDLALEDAKLFKSKMVGYDVDVYMLRSTDTFISIGEIRRRTNEIAEKYVKWVDGKKDYSNVIFVSHHWNSYHDPAATGWEIFANYPNTEGDKAAKLIHEEVKPVLNITDRGVKYARGGLGVLKANPATVLIEHCFISNPSDIKKHLKNRDNMAEAYVKGVAKYLGVSKLKKESDSEMSNLNEEQIREIVRNEIIKIGENQNEPNWATDAIDFVKSKEIMVGDTVNKENFNPNRFVTRAELAQVIYNLENK